LASDYILPIELFAPVEIVLRMGHHIEGGPARRAADGCMSAVGKSGHDSGHGGIDTVDPKATFMLIPWIAAWAALRA
jgi:hypothetical protein